MSAIKDLVENSTAYYESRVEKDIEKNRKGDFCVEFKSPSGVSKVKYKLKRLDFDFGCNIFMLGQYKDKQQEEIYLKQWKNLFNTAVVPLYWEGTEPEKDLLRYSSEVADDVYRRPPVDNVVNYCLENDIKLKGHPLFWHEFIAKWLPEDWEELFPLVEKRFSEIAERYADKIPVFDCVNEPSRLWDLYFETKDNDWKCVFPPEGYLEQVFALGKKYFPQNELILNEATGASFQEFRGVYGSYFQLLKRLISEGLKIDRIGLQCHINDSFNYKNLYDAERFYSILDTYATLKKPLVLSEIGLSCEDEEAQAMAAERLYKICFSHESMSGIFWWNLDDNGILTESQREAAGENLPYGGLVRNGREKKAYKVLDNLINHEWTTCGSAICEDNKLKFRGFYGEYEIEVDGKKYSIDFSKNSSKIQKLEL